MRDVSSYTKVLSSGLKAISSRLKVVSSMMKAISSGLKAIIYDVKAISSGVKPVSYTMRAISFGMKVISYGQTQYTMRGSRCRGKMPRHVHSPTGKFTMTPLERKAHLTLQGQSLKDEWTERCQLCREAERLFSSSYAAICKISGYSQTDGAKLRDEGNKLWAAGLETRRRGDKLWGDALTAAGLTVSWAGASCTLSNGEIYILPNGGFDHDTTRT